MGGCFRRDSATQTTRIPTQTTTTVALTGTMMFRSSHSGTPGNSCRSRGSPPKGGARVPAGGQRALAAVTFGDGVVVLAAPQDAYDGNGDDNDGQRGNDGDNEVEVGEKVHDVGGGNVRLAAAVPSRQLSGRGQRA